MLNFEVEPNCPYFKRCALNYLCVYALFYPLLAHFVMTDTDGLGTGSLPVQLFQGTVIVALIVLWRFARFSVRNCINVWSFGLVYFTLVSFYFAFVRTNPQPRLEILGAARFLSWFLFAATAFSGVFPERYWRQLAFSFWCGSILQGVIATTAFLTHGASSTYSNVYASAGSANVSAKTIVSFVVLSFFLSAYWFVVQRRRRGIWGAFVILALATLLFSYNRASQMAFALTSLFTFVWLFFRERMKALGFLSLVFLAVLLFLYSSYGEVFLVRWNEVVDDQGSGRVTLVSAALKNFVNPNSVETLIIGSGFYKMELLMYEACGAYIGTHSDLFDFLTVYGLIGGVFYFWVCMRLLLVGTKVVLHNTYENLILRLCALFILIAGAFTGLFQATYTFFMLITIQYYMLSICPKRVGNVDVLFDSTDNDLDLLLDDSDVGKGRISESDGKKKNASSSICVKDIDAFFSNLNFENANTNDVQNETEKISLIDEVWHEGFACAQETDKTERDKDMTCDRIRYLDVFFENDNDYKR